MARKKKKIDRSIRLQQVQEIVNRGGVRVGVDFADIADGLGLKVSPYIRSLIDDLVRAGAIEYRRLESRAPSGYKWVFFPVCDDEIMAASQQIPFTEYVQL